MASWLDYLSMIPGLPSSGMGPRVPITRQNTLPSLIPNEFDMGFGYGVTQPEAPPVMPPGWTANTLSKGALGMMPAIPGVGPVARNFDSTVASQPVRVNKPNFMPASNPPPMMGIPQDYGSTFAGMPETPPAPPATPDTPSRFDWGPDNGIWNVLGSMGVGMMQPSWYGLGGQLSQGLAAGQQAAMTEPDRRLRRMLLEGQAGEIKAKAETRRAAADFASTVKDPVAKAYIALGAPDKAIEHLAKRDPAEAQRVAEAAAMKAKAEAEATEPSRIRVAQASKETTKPPAGYQWGPDGVSLVPIPGGPATTIPAEQAGRVAMAENAVKQLPDARKVFLREWTSNDVASAQLEMGEVGRAQRTVRGAIEAGLRMMTGAAAPKSEVDNYMSMFMPKSTDTIETRKQKLDNLEAFMRNAMRLATQGRGGTPNAPSPPSSPNDPMGLR